jgi:hypothetical protein
MSVPAENCSKIFRFIKKCFSVIKVVKQFARYAKTQKCVLQFCGGRFQGDGLWFNAKILDDQCHDSVLNCFLRAFDRNPPLVQFSGNSALKRN